MGFEEVAPPNSTGIKVIVVGAGFAGLACAIECRRKGHEVLILERFAELKVLGDIISFGHNAGRILARWGLHDRIWPICTHHEALSLYNSSGELLTVQKLANMLFGARAYNGHRGELHQILHDYARIECGIEIRLKQDVTEYFEDEDLGIAGVISNGHRIEADIVVGADGVRSKARKLVLGYDDKPKSSGYAIFRAWLDARAQGVDTDPGTSYMCENGDAFHGWIAPDVHFLASSCKDGSTMSLVLTHKDEADIEESWSFPGRMEDVLAVVRDWNDPRPEALLRKAPSYVDWKLVYRDPLPTWLSKGARCVLIGDAAHPFLPTSIQGASQAVEDGVSLAVCLQLAGKERVPLAARAWEKIRYARVRKAQKIGESTRDMWHKAAENARGAAVELPRPEWLLGHDAERHAYDTFATTAADIAKNGYRLPELQE